ncbi:glycosyltransferase [Inediibacterium massiliense]|uniref:glycosyltransferase n=1 Tax=Inediibacterium massiliense TaxID=1658111 RepID=UPI0006B567A5|nr:glycosyltransferase [Inediibacterium massiliense]
MIKPIISIVVPIYKVEDLIYRCVKSLINQTFDNIEIILVDDGSPDNCPKMCDEYAKEDSRITVIHKSNGGLSDARNAGLKAAKGDYVLFVDSDDYIELDSCEKFVNTIGNEKVDIVVAGAKKIIGEKISLMQPSQETINKQYKGSDYLEIELRNLNAKMAVWLNLYRRKFLLENNFLFKVGLLHEDEQWTPRVFLKSKNIIVLGYEFYNYIIRDDSISKAKDFTKNAEHIISIVNELLPIYKELDDKELKLLLNDYLVSIYLFAFKKGKLHLYGSNYTNKKFVFSCSKRTKNKIQSIFYVFSPILFVKCCEVIDFLKTRFMVSEYEHKRY